MTLDEAKSLRYGQTIYEIGAYNADGTARRWRLNGAVVTRETRPNEIRVPIKYGMQSYDYITHNELEHFTLTEPAPHAKNGGKS